MKRSLLVCCVVGTSMALCGSALAQNDKPAQPAPAPAAKPAQPAAPAAKPATPAAPAAKPATPAAPVAKPATPATPAQPEAKKPEAPAGAGASAEMEAWIKAGTPGAEHKALEKFIGTWDAEVSSWMDPAAPPEKSTGTMVMTWVLDGRWIREDFTGTFAGMPFTGIGYWGYDNIQKKYVGSWMDSMSTSAMSSVGTFDEKTQTYSHTSECTDPTGAKCKGRDTIKLTDNDHFTMEMYQTKPGQKETKCMEIKYTRKSAGKGTPPASPAKADPAKSGK